MSFTSGPQLTAMCTRGSDIKPFTSTRLPTIRVMCLGCTWLSATQASLRPFRVPSRRSPALLNIKYPVNRTLNSRPSFSKLPGVSSRLRYVSEIRKDPHVASLTSPSRSFTECQPVWGDVARRPVQGTTELSADRVMLNFAVAHVNLRSLATTKQTTRSLAPSLHIDKPR